MSGSAGNVTAELQAFRDEWKNELSRQPAPNDCPAVAKVPVEVVDQPLPSAGETSVIISPDESYDEAPFPFQFTDSLLRSWQESPPSQCKSEKRKPAGEKATDTESRQTLAKKPRRSLLEVYIDDLNELDDVPFFDISLPREIAVRIFSFLGISDLCACSQVSGAWSSIANDNLIWGRLYHRVQLTFTGQSIISQSQNWKHTVRDCYMNTKTLLHNWKEHKCHITYYHHARGGILTSAHSFHDLLAAGYTNGQVKTWNISTQETQTYEPSNKSLLLLNADEDEVLRTSENSVTCVKLGQNETLIAGYKHGQVQIWSQYDTESMIVSEFPGYCVKDIVTNADLGYVQLRHQSSSSCIVKVLSLRNAGAEAIDSITIGEDEHWTLPKQLMVALTVHSAETTPLVYLSRDSINVHKTTRDAYTSRLYYSSTQLEEFYATHFTCLESSSRYLNVGFTSHLGLQAEYKVRQYDANTLANVSDLRGHTSQVTCIDSSYPSGFTVCTGCHDRRVRLYDSRLPSYAVHTYMGHPDAVQCIQADDWKIVSGDLEGYICVWDQRMANKLWESHSRHPVRYLSFTCQHLISANIPLQTNEQHFDSDKMTHLRYRGRLQLSDFSVEHSPSGVPSICSSSYDIPEASNYNISLITPYDSI